MRALVVTWAPGGNLPPMLAAAGALAGRGQLVTAPRWVDVDAGAPDHVVLGIRTHPAGRREAALLTFSSTIMDGQPELIERLCAAVVDVVLPATLTLGPAVARDAVTVPDEIEVLAVADHDRLMSECSIVICQRPGDRACLRRRLTKRARECCTPASRSASEEDERIVGHPRDASHRVDVRRTTRPVLIEVDGEVLGETTDARLLFKDSARTSSRGR